MIGLDVVVDFEEVAFMITFLDVIKSILTEVNMDDLGVVLVVVIEVVTDAFVAKLVLVNLVVVLVVVLDVVEVLVVDVLVVEVVVEVVVDVEVELVVVVVLVVVEVLGDEFDLVNSTTFLFKSGNKLTLILLLFLISSSSSSAIANTFLKLYIKCLKNVYSSIIKLPPSFVFLS